MKMSELRPNGRVRVYTLNHEPTKTDPQFKDSCDVNMILKKYQTTGVFTHATSKQGQYADLTNITNYQDMLHQVMYANEAFNLLPSSIRTRFGNDPATLLTFIQDPNNYEEALKLGLVNKRPEPPAVQTPNDDSTTKGKKTAPAKVDKPSSATASD
jgi:phage internal scaffolding protein